MRKKLPSGMFYQENWITENLMSNLDNFLNDYKREEEDYYYALQIDVDAGFYNPSIITSWIIKRIDFPKKTNLKTGRKVNWYRMYKNDYEHIKNEWTKKYGKNFFDKLYIKEIKELNLQDSIFITNKNSIEKPSSLPEWFF